MATIFQARFGRKARKGVVLSPAAARALGTLLGIDIKPATTENSAAVHQAPQVTKGLAEMTPRELVEAAPLPGWKSTLQRTSARVPMGR